MILKSVLKKLAVWLRYPELRALPQKQRADAEHLRAAMEWLCVAQDAGGGGVSATYDLWENKWSGPYRETTGYIIETFLQYHKLTGEKKYLERAVRMGEWEMSVQCEDGAVGEVQKNGSVGKKIFNTGQVMLGYLALHRETRDNKYLAATERAALWLVEQQDQDGSWPTHTSRGEAQTIETRVAWPLLDFALLTGNVAARSAAAKNLAWTASMSEPSGWFKNASFKKDVEPWTHQIAYTISGLIECYKLLGESDKKLFDVFYKPARALLETYKKTTGFLPASFDKNWNSKDDYTCLTGDAQLAIVWTQIYNMTGEKVFLDGAARMVEQIKTVQFASGRKETNGGLLGSWPIDGAYSPYKLPNWAAKFFADALMMQTKK